MGNKNNNTVKSVWITANAGSGKTTALTERVVGLLLRGVLPERICCITYTKAAASEMRHRVLGLLRRLLLLPEAECRVLVKRLLGHEPNAAELADARNLFGRVLDSPTGGLQLTTIHGFCQNILSRFPLEAGIAPHFTVLDDAAADGVMRTAKHRLLSSLEDGGAWLEAALSLIGERSGEVRFDTIMADIIKKRSMWEEIWRHQTPELLRARMWGMHGLEEGANEEALIAAFCDLPNADDVATLRTHLPQLLNHSKKTEQKMGQGLARWLETPPAQRPTYIEEFCLLFLNKEGERRKNILGEKEFPAGSMLRTLCDELADQAERFQTARAALACAEESFAIAVVAGELLKLYAQAKEAVHALDYDDLIDRTRELFASPDTLGWVMSKLDHRIDHLLVDEAQDTSAAQWHVIHALVEELIAADGGIGSGEHPRSLLVVGDEKQSIYSFQGAAPELFAARHVTFSELLQYSAAPLMAEVKDISYRSAASVLTLVDHIAAQPEVAAALSAAGVTPPHRLHRADAPGFVALYPPLQTPEKEKLAPLTIPTDYQLVRSGAQMLAEQVADRIAGWLADGRHVAGRVMTAGDILILVRRRGTIVLPLIRALQRRNIPVAGIDRLVLSGHLAVKDLLALMQWCVNPADDLALAQVLRSPLIGLSDDALRALACGRAGTLWAEVDEPKLAQWLTLGQMPPYDFLTDILEVSGTRRAFAERFGEEVHEVLDELKAQAAALPAGMPPTLAHFSAWLAGSSREIKREQEGAGNQLRIMTVHGAKGLEAPVVLLVDTVDVPTTQHEVIYRVQDSHGQSFPVLAISDAAKQAGALADAKKKKSDALLAEYQRLLYVALTRARDELHIFGIGDKKGEVKAGSWYARIASSLKALGAVEEAGAMMLRGAQPQAVSVPPPVGGRLGGGLSGNVGSASSHGNAEFNNAPLPHNDPANRLRSPLLGEEPTALPQWAITPPTATQPILPTTAPSNLAPVEISPYAQTAARGAKERGVRIHRILELLDAKSDATFIQRLTAHIAPDWTTAEQTQTAAEITALTTAHRWLWQHHAQPEASITGTIDINGTPTPIQGQIDLLVETPDAVIILDYKTGRHIPATAGEVSANYLIQLKTYHALVTQLYPTKPVRCAILWTYAPSLMWLDEAVAATPWPKQNVMKQNPVAA